MKALITGGAGFVGSHTSQEFLRSGWDVTVLDAFRVYHVQFDNEYLKNIEYRMDNLLAGAEVVRGTTLDVNDLRRTIEI